MSSTTPRIRQDEGAKMIREYRMLLQQPGLLALITVTLVLLVFFCIYPVLLVFIKTITDEAGNLDFSQAKEILSTRSFLEAFLNSIWLGLVVAVCSTIIGFVFAYAISRTSMRFKRFFHMVAMLPILSPPFVISLSVILLFGRSGVITKTIFGINNSNVYGFTFLAIVQILAMFPLAYLNLRGMLAALDSSVEDAARSLGSDRWQVFRKVTLPLCVPGILSSLLIVFAKSISDFGNPQLLAGDYSVLSVQAYMQIVGMYNLRGGAFMAISILLPSLLAFVIQKYWVAKKSYVTVTGKPSGDGYPIHEKKIVYPLFALCLIVTLVIVLFYGTVVWMSFVKTWGIDMSLSLKNYRFVFSRGLRPLMDSLILSLIATPITAILGMIIAFLLVRKQFFGKRLMQVATMIPFAIPGIVLGIGYILAFNTPPVVLTGTATIIVAALVFRTLSVGIESGTNSLMQVDRSIEEASTTLGANSFSTFTRISLPLMKEALYAGLVNAFVRSMTSISAVIFLVSVNWNLLTVSILSEIESSRLGAASAYCVLLMAVVLLAFGVLNLLMRNFGRRAQYQSKEGLV